MRGHSARACGLMAVGIALLGGCQATHVVYVHSSSLGIDVNVASEAQAKLSVGFDRETFALVPRYTRRPDGTVDTSEKADAMSVAAVSRVYAEGLREVQFGHVVATGSSAVDLAKNPEALKTLAERVFVKIPDEKEAEQTAEKPPESRSTQNPGGGQ